MADVQIRQIQKRRDIKRFVRLAWDIYRDDPHWVPPLISEQMKFLTRGPFFEIGEAAYFLAYRNGQIAGRISAHVNRRHNEHYGDRKGFFGFFECVNDPTVAKALFDASESWLRARGMDTIQGPENFSIYDECTLLVDGFDSSPVVLLTYNPPYYAYLIEGCGFARQVDWYAYLMSKRELPLPEKYYRIRDRVRRRPGLVLRNINMKQFDEEARIIQHIFGTAWSDNWGNWEHLPLTNGQFEHIVGQLKMILEPKLVFMAELDGQPVGFALSVPDANQALQKANGRLFPFGALKIMRQMKKVKRLRTVVLGVLEEYRNMGIDLALYLETIEVGVALGFEDSECSLIAATNTKMRAALEGIGARVYKTYRLYTKEIG